jgi:hypothetical protein
MSLKGQCHEIFFLHFFLQRTPPGSNRHASKQFQNFYLFIREVIEVSVFVIDSVVNNTPGS